MAEEKAILNTQIQELKEKLEESQKKNSLIAEEKAMLNTQIQELKKQIRDLYYQINEKDKLSQITYVQLSELTLKLEETEKNNHELEQQLNKQFHSREEEYQVLLETSKDNENKYKSQIAELERKISELTKTLEKNSSSQKSASKKKNIPNKQYIYDVILPQCSSKNQSHRLFGIRRDDDKNVINLSKLIKLLKDDYGITMNMQQFNYCYTVLGIVNQIAAEANVS